jgi:hypothetical protein
MEQRLLSGRISDEMLLSPTSLLVFLGRRAKPAGRRAEGAEDVFFEILSMIHGEDDFQLQQRI